MGGGLLGAEHGDLDRLSHAVGVPRGCRPRLRAERALRRREGGVHLLQPPRLRVRAAPDHGRAVGSDRMDLQRRAYEPEDRANLFIFTPDAPLEPRDTLTIGFEYDFVFMEGDEPGAWRGGQFILESGIVLTAFGPTFVPVPDTWPGSASTRTTRPNPATTRTTSTRARRNRSSAGAARPSRCGRASRRPRRSPPTASANS